MVNICQSVKNVVLGFWRKLMVKKARILFFGIEKSGKSQFIPTIFGETLHDDDADEDKYRATPRVIARRYEKANYSFLCYDVPGAKNQRCKWDHYFKRADIHVFLVKNNFSAEEMEESRDELQGLIYRNTWIKKPLLVLATMNDLPNGRDVRDIIFDLDLSSIMDREIACFSVSSKTGSNMEEVYKCFAEMTDSIKNKGSIDF